MPNRKGTNAIYDSLSSNAPRAGEKEGYCLLDEDRDLGSLTPPEDPPQDRGGGRKGGYSFKAEALSRKEAQLENGGKHVIANVPWYSTRWGITMIVVILIIGGAVGGAVGASPHSSFDNTSSRTPQPTAILLISSSASASQTSTYSFSSPTQTSNPATSSTLSPQTRSPSLAVYSLSTKV